MIYLGCSQWTYNFWKGNLYPENSKRKNFLRYYSKVFNCVELNSTFYELPDERKISEWMNEAEYEFKFCPKFPGRISHEKYLKNFEQETDEFIGTVMKFGRNLGNCFLQLPPSMSETGIKDLGHFLSYVNGKVNVNVEFRQSWLAKENILKSCLSVLKEHKTGIVMVDGAETIQYLNKLKLTNKTAFVRFLCYNHPTDFERINDWIELIKFWQDNFPVEIYFMLHFGDREREPEIINYTLEKFYKELGYKAEYSEDEKLFS